MVKNNKYRISFLIDEYGINVHNFITNEIFNLNKDKSFGYFNLEFISDAVVGCLEKIHLINDVNSFEVNLAIGNIINNEGKKLLKIYSHDEISDKIIDKFKRNDNLSKISASIKILGVIDVISKINKPKSDSRSFFMLIGDGLSGKLILEDEKSMDTIFTNSKDIGSLNFGTGRLDTFYSFPMIKNKVMLSSEEEVIDLKDLVEKGRNNPTIRQIYDEWLNSMVMLLQSIIVFYSPNNIYVGGPVLERTNKNLKIRDFELSKYIDEEYLSNLNIDKFDYSVEDILKNIS